MATIELTQAGDLVIRDLAYMSIEVLREIVERCAYYHEEARNPDDGEGGVSWQEGPIQNPTGRPLLAGRGHLAEDPESKGLEQEAWSGRTDKGIHCAISSQSIYHER
jgi:hypothetical protein